MGPQQIWRFIWFPFMDQLFGRWKKPRVCLHPFCFPRRGLSLQLHSSLKRKGEHAVTQRTEVRTVSGVELQDLCSYTKCSPQRLLILNFIFEIFTCDWDMSGLLDDSRLISRKEAGDERSEETV